jgi:hypothetical protein
MCISWTFIYILHIIFSFPLRSDTLATPAKVTRNISQQLFQCSILQARHDLYKVCADRNANDKEIKVDVLRRSHHSLAIIIAMTETLVSFPGPFPGIKFLYAFPLNKST